jgi:hypothetical protein
VTTSVTAATTPTTTMAGRSHGRKSALRPSSTYDHSTVSTTVPASTRPFHRRRNIAAPIPTTAPTAGASATV